MKKIILTALILNLFFFLQRSDAQTWHDVDGGIKWNSNVHQELGVFAMTNDTIHHYLYVGGEFDSAGRMPSHNLARWDGKNWSSIGNFYDTAIYALCIYKGNLVMGFYTGTVEIIDSAGNQLNTFQSDEGIYALTIYKGELYAGGDFDEINGIHASGIARYNDTTWSSVDSGIQDYYGGFVESLYVWNNKLYVGGGFSQAGDTLANNIASWNDTAWAPLGSGVYEPDHSNNIAYVSCLGSYNNNLYVGGWFISAGSDSNKNIAQWNGSNWSGIGNISGPVLTMDTFNRTLYFAGSFDSADSINANSIAKWNDTTFFPLGLGTGNFGGPIYSTQNFKKELYAGGNFDSAGTIAANNIARWGADTTTGIEKVTTKNNKIEVYPNPTSNQLTFDSDLPIKEL